MSRIGLSRVGLIWAESIGGVIGHQGAMPWHLPEDLAHFKELTLGSPVIMGRKSWDALPERFRPLPGRQNIVVTRQADWDADGADAVHSVSAALELAAASAAADVWVIGGAEIFAAVIDRADRLEVTEIRELFDGDTTAPTVGHEWRLAASDPEEGWHTSRTGLQYRYRSYVRA
jgi:dihydrofolate reductase